MKLATMMVALVAAVASLAAGGNAFVMPSAAGLAGRNANAAAGNALVPATSQPAPSRSSGASAVGALNVKIVLGEEENVEAALMRFRRTVSRSGHLQELRWKRHFETTAERKKRKFKENRRKERIQRTRERRARDMQNFETVAERKKRKRAMNLRKDKIQRSRERKANEHKF